MKEESRRGSGALGTWNRSTIAERTKFDMIYFSKEERIDKENRIRSYPDFVKKWYYSTVTVHECFNNLLAPFIGSETVLLDAGCGKKGIMNLYKCKNKLSVGTDISLQAMKENRTMDCYVASN